MRSSPAAADHTASTMWSTAERSADASDGTSATTVQWSQVAGTMSNPGVSSTDAAALTDATGTEEGRRYQCKRVSPGAQLPCSQCDTVPSSWDQRLILGLTSMSMIDCSCEAAVAHACFGSLLLRTIDSSALPRMASPPGMNTLAESWLRVLAS